VKKDKYIIIKDYIGEHLLSHNFFVNEIYEGELKEYNGTSCLYLNVIKGPPRFRAITCSYWIPMTHIELLRKNKLRQL
jgi:hypothetical protein